MANVLLGVTGSVAALKTPTVYEALLAGGHDVKVVATKAALYFFDPLDVSPLFPQSPIRNRDVVYLDEDEWPGAESGRRWRRDEPVLHIELRRWADVFVVAPLDANTLAKLSYGLADNCLTCVARAWDQARGTVLAPAMNTLMWDNPITARQLAQLARDRGMEPPAGMGVGLLPEWINSQRTTLRVVPPESRRLACGDVGVGAMGAVDRIAAEVAALTTTAARDTPT